MSKCLPNSETNVTTFKPSGRGITRRTEYGPIGAAWEDWCSARTTEPWLVILSSQRLEEVTMGRESWVFAMILALAGTVASLLLNYELGIIHLTIPGAVSGVIAHSVKVLWTRLFTRSSDSDKRGAVSEHGSGDLTV